MWHWQSIFKWFVQIVKQYTVENTSMSKLPNNRVSFKFLGEGLELNCNKKYISMSHFRSWQPYLNYTVFIKWTITPNTHCVTWFSTINRDFFSSHPMNLWVHVIEKKLGNDYSQGHIIIFMFFCIVSAILGLQRLKVASCMVNFHVFLNLTIQGTQSWRAIILHKFCSTSYTKHWY